ncbi:MAG: class I SAM-dependent methyltransferase [Patescibacteria group bacterium]|jgi:SAM-dependent methyltransferase
MSQKPIYSNIYKIKYIFKSLITGKKTEDDFDWNLYPKHYSGELKEVEKDHTTIIKANDYALDNGRLSLKSNILPLHPNHLLLYETILQLSPSTALEVGCGGGDHLHNLKILQPSLTLFGEDLSEKQIKLLHKRHPDLDAAIKQHDILSSSLLDWPPIDIVFTQAVIMHIRTEDNHLIALSNLFKMATKQVVLMENWTKHNFVEDILLLKQEGKIPWPELYLYSRPHPITERPHILIASALPLEGYTKVLHDEHFRQNS